MSDLSTIEQKTAPTVKTKPRSGGRVPKYVQLADDFRRQLKSGELVAGQQLPSFAAMQEHYGIAQTTLDQVYNLLERDGLIVRTPGRGTFVAEGKPQLTSGVIGVQSEGALHHHPYYRHTLRGIQDGAREFGLAVLLVDQNATQRNTRFDGLILYQSQAPTLKTVLSATPRVSVIFHDVTMPSVIADDYQGMKQAVQHLLKLNHRRISFLTTGIQKNADLPSSQRLRAYRDALSEAGITPPPSWIRPLYGPWTPQHEPDLQKCGFQKMTQWLQEGWTDLGCTAILAQNDEVAIGIIEALRDAGLQVPHDVSVIGFDGTEVANYAHPRLTTVAVPLQAVGEKAVHLLCELIQDPLAGFDEAGGQYKKIVVPTELREGASTAPAPVTPAPANPV